MAYVDANYQVQFQDAVVGAGPATGVSLGTNAGTGTSTTTYTGTLGTAGNGWYRLPIFKQPTKLVGVRVYCVGAAGTGVTGVNFQFYNGTSLAATALNVGTAASQLTDATMVAVTVASNGAQTGAVLMTSTTTNELTMVTTNTGTATASTLGTYAIDFILQNLFTT